MRITSADRWFSLCVRERAGWRCERCGTQYWTGHRGLHCSHFIGRANWAVRFEPLNAYAHCYGCHSFFEQNPHKFTAWAKDKLGDRYLILLEKAENIELAKEVRRTKGKGSISLHFKNQHELIIGRRAIGVLERVEFVGWL